MRFGQSGSFSCTAHLDSPLLASAYLGSNSAVMTTLLQSPLPFAQVTPWHNCLIMYAAVYNLRELNKLSMKQFVHKLGNFMSK